MCQPHWQKLRAEIAERGLDHLVGKGGEMAVAQLADQLEKGKATPTNFDPLMAAHNMILSNALDTAGLQIMFDPPDGERCPLCFLVAVAAEHGFDPAVFEKWPARAADGALDAARTLGLVAA